MDWSGPWWMVVLGIGNFARDGHRGLHAAVSTVWIWLCRHAYGLLRVRRDPPFSTDDRKGFNLFSRGYAGKWTNMLADNPEVPSTLLFDFSYRFGLRIIASVGYCQTVAAFSARLTGLPDFQLTPATALERLAPKLGIQGLRFESRPKLGKRHWLRAKDEISVRAIFTDAFIDRLAVADPRALWYVEKSGRWLLVYSHGKTYAPQALAGFLGAARVVADLFLATH